MNQNVRRYIALFCLSMGAAASYTLPYIKYIFYDAWVDGLGLAQSANESAGWLLTYHMIGCILLYIPGGYIADRFSPKRIIIISLLGTALLNVWYAFDPTYSTGRIIWFLLAFTVGFAYWAAMIKAVRMLGSPQEQGKMYGWYNAGEGAFASVILGVATVFYGISQVALISLQYAVLVQAAFCVIAAVATGVFFNENAAVCSGEENEHERFHMGDVLKVIKNPWVWCVSGVVMCTYGAYTGQSYLTPYMTQVLQVSATMGAFLGIARTKGARFIGGPIGGIIADRIGSPCKVIIGSNILMILLFGLFFLLPMSADSTVLAIGLSLLVALVTFAGYNIMFASMEEAHIPRYLTGTAVGVVSIMGYTPDGFVNALFGNWLDNYGDAGHHYIFAALIAMCLAGSFFAFLIMRRNQRIVRQRGVGENTPCAL